MTKISIAINMRASIENMIKQISMFQGEICRQGRITMRADGNA
jgi:hypothetical protein